ncbi:hypothetical protein B9479_006687 [Cryptococcus floricola]|uniref:SEC7 domain-containing protein n=1 Tax=Cryptococcus floricola TaxID=2591691 RepID=A0A5D3AR45_9TREE|nr:hypothetical protein B9479_006687 [Cryptococcus floricola]
MDYNPEAGPSRPRPLEATPPSTPTASVKAKRRSWFGIASPVTPLGKDKGRDKRRESVASTEELELSPVVTSSRQDESFAEGGVPNQRYGQDELLTIEGELEQTVKKKKRRSGGVEELQTMRMEDFSSKNSSRNVSDKTVVPSDVDHAPRPFVSRASLRAASDRDPFSLTETTYHPHHHSEAPHMLSSSGEDAPSSLMIRPTPRSSSLRSTPSPNVPSNIVGKSQPPLPVNIDRPLPPLPPPVSTQASEAPQGPSNILITPSTPRKLTKSSTTKRAQDGERRSRSAGRPRSHSRKRSQSTDAPRNIGLGLPSVLSGRSRSTSRARPSTSPGLQSPPPPVPSKPQSVSSPFPVSPFPSRPASPSPRIAFVEPTIPTDERMQPKEAEGERRGRVKRARSLSGLFGKTSPMVPPAKVNESPSVDISSEAEEGNEHSGAGRVGVLEWLGVRKTVKRKTSQIQLQDKETETQQASVDEERHVRSPPQDIPLQARPPIQASSSESQQSTPGKLSSIFNRRTTGRNNADETEPLSINVARSNAKKDGHPPPSSSHSQSSFQLPTGNPVSPFVPEGGTAWISSPGTDHEEIIHSPGGSTHWGPGVRPWMDVTDHHVSSRNSVASALDTLPEQEQLPAPQEMSQPTNYGPLKAPAKFGEGRVRSWSDAPLPARRPEQTLISSSITSRETPATPATPVTPNTPQTPSSPVGEFKVPIRPKLGSRQNSGNSAILGRMKSVFTKSTSRSRSNSLLRQRSGDVDEFGGLVSQRMRPSTSSSSVASSVPGRNTAVTSDETQAEPQYDGKILAGTERPSRTSMTPSLSSNNSSHRQSILLDPSHAHKPPPHRSRVRASTVSLAPTSYHFTPSSPVTFPTAATPPRRQGTIRRLSNGLFGASTSPQPASLFPLPPRSSGSTSSIGTGVPGDESSFGTSPRPSTGSLTTKPKALKEAAIVHDEETPRHWLNRVIATVGRGEISNVLAASGDDFHTDALRMYMEDFDFSHSGLDVALRKLLMQMSLPKETQQIDRVMEAFAKQYEVCEPGLFDNAYVLAFSMMMLHTDAFNKHNKNKMTKADYVRNSRMEGVPPFVLETFFDNITFTPFVFIEDDAELECKRSGGAVTPSSFGPSTPNFSTLLNASNPSNKLKVDVYDLIVRDMLDPLRIDMSKEVPAESPFSCMGTRPFLDLNGLSQTFATAHNLLIPAPQLQRKGTGKMATPGKKQLGRAHSEGDMSLRVTKVGLISRKDEGNGENSKKISRKWKSWSVVLTQSQLLFFKDPTWALTLLEARASSKINKNGHLLLPRMAMFKPDEVFPVKDCIAVFDHAYTSQPNTFRFVISQHQQYLMQAADEFEMNEWVTLINYASAFKTAGIKMRGATMRKDQAVLAGAAAAASHRRDLRGGESQTSLHNGIGSSSGRRAVFGDPGIQSGLQPRKPSTGEVRGVDVDGANERLQEGEQLEEVFGVVKAELAAGRGGAESNPASRKQSLQQQADSPYSHVSRVAVIENQLRVLREKVTPVESAIRSSLILARNIQLLTPFQKSTRDHLSSLVPSIARRVRTERITLSKLHLWINVLQWEAEREEREWKEVRHVALQAAARSLREDGVRGVVHDVARDEGEGRSVPVLELPEDNDDADDGDHFSTSPGELPIMFRRPSDDDRDRRWRPTSRDTTISITTTSTAPNSRRQTVSSDNLLSPMESERKSSDTNESPVSRTGTLDDADVLDRPKVPRRKDSYGDMSSGRMTPMFVMESPMDIGEEGADREDAYFGSHNGESLRDDRSNVAHVEEEGDMGEEAEDWQKTKAAKRVSLVRPGEMGDWTTMRQVSAGSRVV